MSSEIFVDLVPGMSGLEARVEIGADPQAEIVVQRDDLDTNAATVRATVAAMRRALEFCGMEGEMVFATDWFPQDQRAEVEDILRGIEGGELRTWAYRMTDDDKFERVERGGGDGSKV